MPISRIPKATQTATGWAIHTADQGVQREVLERKEEWIRLLGALHAETRQIWYNYIVEECPRTIPTWDGRPVDFNECFREEVITQTGTAPMSFRPTRAQRYRQRNPEHTTAPNEDRTQFTEARFSPHLANEKERLAGEERDNDPIIIDAEPLSPQPPEGPEEEEPTNPITPLGPGSVISLSTEAPAASLVVSHLARTKTLRIFQANVGKIGPAHDTALALADTEEFDIILMQEPWVSLKGDSMTKTHPGYRIYSPVNSWEGTRDRPRVMTYIRRNLELDADQTRPVATRDILWIKTSDITIVNIYRDPDVPETLEAILTWPIPDRCLIAGDFNARHCSWEPGANAEHQGGRIVDWAEETELAQLVPAAPTNPRNTTIDLAFTNIPLAEAAVEEHLLTSADHYPITITIPEIRLQSRPRKRARLRTSKETQRFLSLIQEGARDLPTQTTNTDDLDSLATAIIELI
ncbi:hypothetical protein PT974_10953 [Cladobotryum mycophilum]|uniref:Endonuclease/exonuclease/phosphatase domain-containing protein n=1 Tax=Cladobotryum mycophilum TaxID=491253 RepID=A0ABR0SBU6_9HYPO